MIFNFYDIESLENVFTIANYIPHENKLDVYFLIDNKATVLTGVFETAVSRVHSRNKNFTGAVCFYDLSDPRNVQRLAKTFGASDLRKDFPNPKKFDSRENKYRLVCDTDPNYDPEKHPYLMGYNSCNYDTTMLAMYFYLRLYRKVKNKPVDMKVTAEIMRKFNDRLFSDFKSNMPKALEFEPGGVRPNRNTPQACIRRNMLLSGRHLDVARLNEKQQHIGLKRLLGTLGYQILESDKLKMNASRINNFDEFCELVAYNASDVINLALLFNHDLYQAQFALKRELLNTYPQLVYRQKYDAHGNLTYDANVQPSSVRPDRLTIDSSSAQFATKCLCPYDHLSDLPVVSYMYPSERKAKELGIKQVNVLEETRKFFYDNFPQEKLRARFDKIYNYYKAIEGKNFNDSDFYKEDHKLTYPAMKLSDIPKTDCCIPYFDKNGIPTSCFVLFSIGGIHGAEFNRPLYVSDYTKYIKLMSDLEYVKSKYPNPLELKNAGSIEMRDGSILKASNFLRANNKEYKTYKEPCLFVQKEDGGTELNKKYVYTSVVPTNHEDFTSYYPNMLRMMSAFWNPGLGYDRYAEIFENKQKYGKLMKDKSLSEQERAFYAVMREGTKLILNSASGAADTNNKSPIQMNNRIISMRIIGQLFSYRIGQAQTIAGARIVSTNTDGLYSVLEKELNNMILEKESANIGVEIEPEPLFLISKDANNRMELSENLDKIFSASGSSLACMKGPNPAKSLAHPAIIDWALCEYLKKCAEGSNPFVAIDKPFDYDTGEALLASAYDVFAKKDPVSAKFHWLNMFQMMIASSPGTDTYIYGKKKLENDSLNNIIIMQHYNRVFFMEKGTKFNCVHLQAAYAPSVNHASLMKRSKNGEPEVIVSREAEYVLSENGVKIINTGVEKKDIATRKVTGIDPEWNVYILNQNLNELTDKEFNAIRNGLCYDNYLELLSNAFTNSWQNEKAPSNNEIKYEKAETAQMTLF